MRIALAFLCAIALAGAAAFITFSERTIAAGHAALRDFDNRAREAVDGLAELRAAQQAYVAVGQGTSFWIPKVDETSRAVAAALAALKQNAVSGDAAAAVDSASTAFADFGEADRRIRGYLKTGAQLMAADMVFTEGGHAAVAASRAVETARLAERVAFDSFDSARRVEEVAAVGGLSTLMLMTIFGFARKARIVVPGESVSATALVEKPVSPASAAVTNADELPLRADAWPGDQLRPQTQPLPAAVEPPRNSLFFKAVAELCTDIGRVGDLEQLRALLGRTAQLLDASGLVLWSASPSGAELQPAITHGYPAQTVARIPSVPYTADNAAAAAYRTGKLQVVPSRPGSSVKGALVAPVISVDGCIGVLSAELRGGGENSDHIQAMASILAAQLAGVLAAAPASQDAAARASGTASA